jgi:hypothetical protein
MIAALLEPTPKAMSQASRKLDMIVAALPTVPTLKQGSLIGRLSPRSFACFTAAAQAPVAASALAYVVVII